MRYLSLIALISSTIQCVSSSGDNIKLVEVPATVCGSITSDQVCANAGLEPFKLQAGKVADIVARLQAQQRTNPSLQRAIVGGWNDEKIDMVVDINAGTVTPLAPINRTNWVICKACSGPAPCPPAPCPPAPCAPVCPPAPCAPICPPAPCAPVCPPAPCPPVCDPCAPCVPECRPPRVPIFDGRRQIACCLPKKCVVKRKCHPCDSPCVQNYPHDRVYVIDELTVFCEPFVRVLETRCSPCRRGYGYDRDRVFTVSKYLPPFPDIFFPFPLILKDARILHKILCEAREKFGQCGCVCLFIDHFGRVFVAVDGDYYKVDLRNNNCPPPFPFPFPFPGLPFAPLAPELLPAFPFPRPFCPPFCPAPCDPCPPCGPVCPPCGPVCPPFPGPFPGPFPFPPLAPGAGAFPFPGPFPLPGFGCGPARGGICNPCNIVPPCKPARRVDECGRPCPSEFVFCKIKCEEMIRVRKFGLHAVLFSRNLDCFL